MTDDEFERTGWEILRAGRAAAYEDSLGVIDELEARASPFSAALAERVPERCAWLRFEVALASNQPVDECVRRYETWLLAEPSPEFELLRSVEFAKHHTEPEAQRRIGETYVRRALGRAAPDDFGRWALIAPYSLLERHGLRAPGEHQGRTKELLQWHAETDWISQATVEILRRHRDPLEQLLADLEEVRCRALASLPEREHEEVEQGILSVALTLALLHDVELEVHQLIWSRARALGRPNTSSALTQTTAHARYCLDKARPELLRDDLAAAIVRADGRLPALQVRRAKRLLAELDRASSSPDDRQDS
jgi:hypothetical protein